MRHAFSNTGLLALTFILVACGRPIPETSAPAPTIEVTQVALEATPTAVSSTVEPTIEPAPNTELPQTRVDPYLPVVEQFIATNQIAVDGVTHSGDGQIELDATGKFPVEIYTDALGNKYTVDPKSKTIVVFEGDPALRTVVVASPLSETALYDLAEDYMLLNAPNYMAMREGFSLPEKHPTGSEFVVKWVLSTTCRRDGSFPYIEVETTLDGKVLTYRNTLVRGDLVGAYGDINQSMVNVRSGPGLEYEVLSVTGAGRLIILGQYEDRITGERWWQIPINCAQPTSGWVRNEFVTIDPDFVEAVPIKQSPSGQ